MIRNLIAKDFVKEFFKTGLPVIGSHVVWSLGATTLFMIYARVGTAAVTAMNISGSFATIAFIAIVGIGSAVGVIVGQELGRGNEETAYKLSKDMLKLNGKLGLIVGFIIMISADLLVPSISLMIIEREYPSTISGEGPSPHTPVF